MRISIISASLAGQLRALAGPLFIAAIYSAVSLTAITSTAKEKDPGPKHVFFPPAPDAPRLQFLTSFSSEKDLRGGKSGSLMTFITGTPPPNKLLGKPYGAVLNQKKIYLCDTAYGEVLKLDLESQRITSIDSRGPGAFKLPLNIAIDTDGFCYVADSGRDEVVILDKTENFVAAIGGKGVMKPRDVVIAGNRLYVGDIQNHCIHVYERTTRTLLFEIPRGEDATNINRKLYQPANIAVDSQGRVYASDVGSDRVQVYDAEGKYVRTVGHYGDNAGEFSRPKGIAVDREGRLYAVDAAAQVVQLFDDQGQLLMWFGEPRSGRASLELPAKVVVDYESTGLFQKYAAPDFQVEYLVIVTNQYGPRKVSVFGFGHKK